MSADVSAVERIERRLAAHARFDEPWDKGYLQGLRDGLYDVKEADCTARAAVERVRAELDKSRTEYGVIGNTTTALVREDAIRAALDGAAADPAATEVER